MKTELLRCLKRVASTSQQVASWNCTRLFTFRAILCLAYSQQMEGWGGLPTYGCWKRTYWLLHAKGLMEFYNFFRDSNTAYDMSVHCISPLVVSIPIIHRSACIPFCHRLFTARNAFPNYPWGNTSWRAVWNLGSLWQCGAPNVRKGVWPTQGMLLLCCVWLMDFMRHYIIWLWHLNVAIVYIIIYLKQ